MKVADYRMAAAKAMSEDDLTEAVRELCTGLGLHRWHTLHSKGSPAGWVDEVIAGPSGVLFRELKRQDGRVTAAQTECIEVLRVHGFDVAVWRPIDLHQGRILVELRAISRRH